MEEKFSFSFFLFFTLQLFSAISESAFCFLIFEGEKKTKNVLCGFWDTSFGFFYVNMKAFSPVFLISEECFPFLS